MADLTHHIAAKREQKTGKTLNIFLLEFPIFLRPKKKEFGV
jgi:hypothetical protein